MASRTVSDSSGMRSSALKFFQISLRSPWMVSVVTVAIALPG